jgi:adenylate cyclase
MATETERKFLVEGEFRHLAVGEIDIMQAYISVERANTTRIRIAGQEAFLTIKSQIAGELIARNEWEFKIPLSDAMEMIKISLPGKIVKTRYFIPVGKHTWEVDVFHDKNEGLVIAEIELGSENEKFVKPDWLGKEVTGDPRYYNSNLIK